MRLPFCLALLLVPWSSEAWDTAPHQQITRAALDRLPARFLGLLGAEAAPLVQIYCLYPDRYLEMEQFGFVRASPGPRTAAEIRRFCELPGGRTIHGATGDRGRDIDAIRYLFERARVALAERHPGEAARYLGVLSHFIADSLSPSHSVPPEDLLEISDGVEVHALIERSIPAFALLDRRPRVLTADAVVEQCYAGAHRNRLALPAIVKAALAHDEPALDLYRLRAANTAAALLADAFFTLAQSVP
jgi:hypothetical protein